MKQISRKEKNHLMSMLPQYEEYVKRRHGRSFVQYLGCHSMTLRWAFSGKVYFVVMANVLPPHKCDLTFDLKGATSNRQRARDRALEELQAGSRAPGSFKTLLDKDWMHLKMGSHLRLPEARRVTRCGACVPLSSSMVWLSFACS